MLLHLSNTEQRLEWTFNFLKISKWSIFVWWENENYYLAMFSLTLRKFLKSFFLCFKRITWVKGKFHVKQIEYLFFKTFDQTDQFYLSRMKSLIENWNPFKSFSHQMKIWQGNATSDCYDKSTMRFQDLDVSWCSFRYNCNCVWIASTQLSS